MGKVGKAMDVVGRVSTLDWLLRLAPSGLAILTWALGVIQGWDPLTIFLVGLVAGAATFGIATAIHYWIGVLAAERLPEHHKAILRQLADALAEMKASALTVGSWERMNPTPHQTQHSERHRDIVHRAAQLIDQISYDAPTASTCKDFAQLCSFIVYDAIHKQDYRESRLELDRMSVGLFRYLHDGKSVDRSKIDLPDWIRENDEKARLNGLERDRSSVRRVA